MEFMRDFKFIVFVVVLQIAIVLGVPYLHEKFNPIEVARPAAVSTLKPDPEDVIRSGRESLAEAGVSDSGVWKTGPWVSDTLIYVVHKIPAGEEFPGGGEMLRVYDGGTVVLEEKANDFNGIETTHILRTKIPQMIVKSVNFGGSGNYFRVYDFRDGKVVQLTNDDDTLYSGSVAIVPQFQNPRYFELPLQVLLSQQIASESAEATVLRFENDRFRPAGTIDQKTIGQFIVKNTKKVE